MNVRPSFAGVADRLRAAITDRVTPAATIEVGNAAGVIWRSAFGALTYDDAADACRVETIFDLASLTKVIATATLAMRAAEIDARFCETRVAELVPEWRAHDRRDVTVRHLLEHASGLPAHVKLFTTAHGREAFRQQIAATSLAYAPGTASQYSDLGFILLGLILEAQLGATLDVLFEPVAAHLDGPLLFCPPDAMRAAIAPTEFDAWRGHVLRGEVHDENASAIGGVAGHAGLFGDVRAVGSLARVILNGLTSDTWLARRDTLRAFVQRSQVPGSSRALGWDTMLPTSSCGTRMSPSAFGHTGFTGTSLWIDPERDVYLVLLTNRVHPSRDGEGIQPLRRDVADLVMDEIIGRPPSTVR